ncbi:MAG TPA: Clp protease N-terminal domain-containing protein [Actinomycetota bacterium]
MAADPSLDQLIARIREADESGPLNQLAAAVDRGAGLTALADLLVDHFVQAARAAGHSWAEVGKVLGVSKQAAQQRYVGGRLQVVAGSKRHGMLEQLLRVAEFTLGLEKPGIERFTVDARRAVVRARELAHELGHPQVGTEHLLLGTLTEPRWLSTQTLLELGLTSAGVRRKVEQALGAGTHPVPAGPPIPFSPRAKHVLELAMREAVGLGHNYIEPHHVLLGVLRNGEGWGAGILDELGVGRRELRDALERAVRSRVETPPAGSAGAREPR